MSYRPLVAVAGWVLLIAAVVRSTNVLQRDLYLVQEENHQALTFAALSADRQADAVERRLAGQSSRMDDWFIGLDSRLRQLQQQGEETQGKIDGQPKVKPPIDTRRFISQSVEVRYTVLSKLLGVGKGHGSGSVIALDSSWIYVLTAAHVVDHMKDSTDFIAVGTVVRFPTAIPGPAGVDSIEWEERDVTVLHSNDELDIAILRCRRGDLTPIPVRIARTARLHEPVFQLGYPSDSELVLSTGFISSARGPKKSGAWKRENVWTVCFPTFFGYSGSGVISLETGELVGISAGMDGRFHHISLVVAQHVILRWFEDIGFRPTPTPVAY